MIRFRFIIAALFLAMAGTAIFATRAQANAAPNDSGAICTVDPSSPADNH